MEISFRSKSVGKCRKHIKTDPDLVMYNLPERQLMILSMSFVFL